jgi:hypothetical protein
MSHLRSHQQKEFTQKIGILIGAFVILTIFFFTIGLKLFISLGVFINNTFAKDTDTSLTKQTPFFGSVELDTLPTATNSARITVSGSASNFDTIQFFINSKKVKEVELLTVSTFSEEIGSLKKGQNTIYIKALSKKHKEEKKSESYTVQYKKEKIKLEITEPTENQTVRQQDLKVAGSTDSGNSVQINGGPVVVDVQGNFQTSIRLKEGDNTIEIAAEDIAGNIEKKTLTVKYQKEE